MVQTRKGKETKPDQISFRVSINVRKKLESDAETLGISSSQFARNIIVKYYQKSHARNEVHETGFEYNPIDRENIKKIIQQEIKGTIDKILFTETNVDKLLDAMSERALEKRIEKK
jgi:hypothetical protein